jgi:hypothetical protein
MLTSLYCIALITTNHAWKTANIKILGWSIIPSDLLRLAVVYPRAFKRVKSPVHITIHCPIRFGKGGPLKIFVCLVPFKSYSSVLISLEIRHSMEEIGFGGFSSP